MRLGANIGGEHASRVVGVGGVGLGPDLGG